MILIKNAITRVKKYPNEPHKQLVRDLASKAFGGSTSKLVMRALDESTSKEEIEDIAADLRIENLPLNHDEIGIYFFSGSEIKAYDIGEYGVSFQDFNQVTNTILNAGEDLGERLFEHLNPSVTR